MEHRDNELIGFAIGFLGGALLGAAAGVLLAPKSGRETRAMLKDYARRAEEDLFGKVEDLQAALEEWRASCCEQARERPQGYKEHPRAPVT